MDARRQSGRVCVGNLIGSRASENGELIILHTTILTFLEKKKNLLGQLKLTMEISCVFGSMLRFGVSHACLVIFFHPHGKLINLAEHRAQSKLTLHASHFLGSYTVSNRLCIRLFIPQMHR